MKKAASDLCSRWFDLVASEFMLTPAVLAMRVPVIMGEAFASSGGRPETTRALTEKVAATAEGIAQAQLSAFRSAMAFWPALALGQIGPRTFEQATEQALRAALRPAARELRANHRRLSRKARS